MSARHFAAAAFSLAFIAAAIAPGLSAEEPADALKAGKLPSEFSMTALQGGFAGFTGEKWVVKPNGEWSISRVFNQKIDEPHTSGKLKPDQLAKLAKLLAKHELTRLPEDTPAFQGANPNTITFALGKAQSTCSIPPDRDALGSIDKKHKATVEHFLAIEKAVSELMPIRKDEK